MNLKLLYKFKDKYGEPIKIVNYPTHIGFVFAKNRWVSIDQTGEMSWDGKKNEFNIREEYKYENNKFRKFKVGE